MLQSVSFWAFDIQIPWKFRVIMIIIVSIFFPDFCFFFHPTFHIISIPSYMRQSTHTESSSSFTKSTLLTFQRQNFTLSIMKKESKTSWESELFFCQSKKLRDLDLSSSFSDKVTCKVNKWWWWSLKETEKDKRSHEKE